MKRCYSCLPSLLHGRLPLSSCCTSTISTVSSWWRVSSVVQYSSNGYHVGRFYCTGTSVSKTYKRIVLNRTREWTTSHDHEKNNSIAFEKENIWTLPNLLTVSRIISSPILGYLIINEYYTGALGLFAVASVTDLLDGLIARHFPSQSSKLGSFMDPLADKCLISVLYISLTFMNLIPFPLTLLILSRDVSLISGSFYLRYLTLPPPRTLARFWDIERSGLQITPNLLGKVNTLLQLMLIGCTMVAPVVGVVNHPLLQALWYIVGTSTVASWISYCVQLKGFQIINYKQKLQ